jgi:hypothetical protein
MMVIGIIIANSLVIQGAKDASIHVERISAQVVIQANIAVELIADVENETQIVYDGLLEYNRTAYLELDRLKGVLMSTRATITNIVTTSAFETADERKFVFDTFMSCSAAIDVTLEKAEEAADKAKSLTGSLNVENNTNVEFVSKVMRMLDGMLTEIQKSEEMVVTMGKVGAATVNKYANATTAPVTLDLSIIFEFARKIRVMIATIKNFMAQGRLLRLKTGLPETEDSAVAMVRYVAETGDNVTKVRARIVATNNFTHCLTHILPPSPQLLDSQFNTLFDSGIGTIDIMQGKLDLYVDQMFKKNCDDLLKSLAEMRKYQYASHHASPLFRSPLQPCTVTALPTLLSPPLLSPHLGRNTMLSVTDTRSHHLHRLNDGAYK